MPRFRCAGSGSSGNAYTIETDSGEILLIECGVSWNKILKMIDFKILDVAGCLVTHSHLDHISAFKDVLKNGIQIYTNDETAEHFEVVSGEKMIGKQEKIPFEIGSFTVTPFYLPHTTKDADTGRIIPCPNFGYIIQQEEIGTLLYMTDMEYCQYSFKRRMPNHLVIECNYIDDLVDREQNNYVHRLRGHCSLNTCKGIVQINKTSTLRTVTLIHLSDKASDEKRMVDSVKKIVGENVEVNVAKPGLSVDLNKFPF